MSFSGSGVVSDWTMEWAILEWKTISAIAEALGQAFHHCPAGELRDPCFPNCHSPSDNEFPPGTSPCSGVTESSGSKASILDEIVCIAPY